MVSLAHELAYHLRRRMAAEPLVQKTRMNAIPAAYLVAVGVILAFAVVRLRWTYVVGIAFAVGVLYVLIILKRFEVVLVGVFAAALIVEDAFRGGVQAGTFEIGYREFVLAALLLVYLWDSQRMSRGAGSRATRSSANRVASSLFGLYITCFFFSAVLTDEFLTGLRVWITLALEAFVVFWLTRNMLRSRERQNYFVPSIMALMTLVSINENAKMLLGLTFIPYRYPDLNVQVTYAQFGLTSVRVLPVLTQAPFAGALMTSFFPLALALALREPLGWRRGFYLLTSASLAFNIVFYLDRGTWLACILSLLALAVLRTSRAKVWLLCGIVLACVCLGVLVVGPRVEGMSWMFSGRSDSDTIFQSVRLIMWAKVLEALPHLPLFGVGWGDVGWNTLLGRYSTLSYPSMYGQGPFYWTQPHNSYLHLLLAAGFPAFACFAGLISLTIVVGLRRLGSRTDAPERGVLLGFFAGLMGLLAESAVDMTLWLTPINVLLWTLVGAVWALSESSRCDDPPEDRPWGLAAPIGALGFPKARCPQGAVRNAEAC